MRRRIAVLASGRGSNLRALLDYLHSRGEQRGGDVVLVVSDKNSAGALSLAAEHGVRAEHVMWNDAHEEVLRARLTAVDADVIALAGFLRLLPAALVRDYVGRIVNVHPALLPAFGGKGMYGDRVHRAVIDSGARVSGPTVHFVDESYDRGAIIAQWPVPVFASDTPAELAARVLHAEHRLFPRVVDAVAAGRLSLGGDLRVQGLLDVGRGEPAFALITDSEAAHDETMDRLFAR